MHIYSKYKCVCMFVDVQQSQFVCLQSISVQTTHKPICHRHPEGVRAQLQHVYVVSHPHQHLPDANVPHSVASSLEPGGSGHYYSPQTCVRAVVTCADTLEYVVAPHIFILGW